MTSDNFDEVNQSEQNLHVMGSIDSRGFVVSLLAIITNDNNVYHSFVQAISTSLLHTYDSMSTLQALTASSSSPSLDDSLQRNRQHHDKNENSMHDIVVDFGAEYNKNDGSRYADTGQLPTRKSSKTKSAHVWKYIMFTLVRHMFDDYTIALRYNDCSTHSRLLVAL
jgi:hypothetical protein